MPPVPGPRRTAAVRVATASPRYSATRLRRSALLTTLTEDNAITAPGLSAQGVAATIEGFPKGIIPKAHFGKGIYFRLSGKAPFARLIYPPPIPGALGTHYRRDMGGQGVFGPDLNFVDVLDFSVDPGAAPAFYAYIRRFWPGLPYGSLHPKKTVDDTLAEPLAIHGIGDAETRIGRAMSEVGLPASFRFLPANSRSGALVKRDDRALPAQ
eukprot:gene39567-biopygen26456